MYYKNCQWHQFKWKPTVDIHLRVFLGVILRLVKIQLKIFSFLQETITCPTIINMLLLVFLILDGYRRIHAALLWQNWLG